VIFVANLQVLVDPSDRLTGTRKFVTKIANAKKLHVAPFWFGTRRGCDVVPRSLRVAESVEIDSAAHAPPPLIICDIFVASGV